YNDEQKKVTKYAKDSEPLHIKKADLIEIPTVFNLSMYTHRVELFVILLDSRLEFFERNIRFYHTDLQPNIGLFWYFFTEMFEHFRTLFLYTFQMNATVLYLFPLTIKLHKKPLLLATILTALITIFRSYPCIGDVALYMALFPLWKSSAKFMANNFIVFCFLLITSALGPMVWYLWIYCNSANANFYFGTTLAFASAQIFLVTDLLFASNKREFCLREGLSVITKIALE
ncbi:Phosphatidylinositol glycan anchor biosynthesis class U protein, partial [Pseudolycoriella hygida]